MLKTGLWRKSSGAPSELICFFIERFRGARGLAPSRFSAGNGSWPSQETLSQESPPRNRFAALRYCLEQCNRCVVKE
jgi:hypothetical protein